MADHFRTLATRVEARLKFERSDFLGIAFPVPDEEEFFHELGGIQKRSFDATHHCWAFRLFDGQRTRSSDAGEPSGTAGKPILGAIEAAGLHDLGVVVVRWFGGVKLGTGGLSRAYRDTAVEVLRQGQSLDRFVYQRYRVVVPFDAMSIAYRLVDPPSTLLAEEHFGEEYEFLYDVRASQAGSFESRLTERRLRFERMGSPAVRAPLTPR